MVNSTPIGGPVVVACGALSSRLLAQSASFWPIALEFCSLLGPQNVHETEKLRVPAGTKALC